MAEPAANRRVRLAVTLGDAAGIGPEVAAKAVLQPAVAATIEPVFFGHPGVLERALRIAGDAHPVRSIDRADSAVDPGELACVAAGPSSVLEVPWGVNDSRTGEGAFAALQLAAEACLQGHVDAVVTAPLSKAALHLAGHNYPGHTEILAEICGVGDFAMMLYLPPGELVRGPLGLGVVHVTLHTSVASVPHLLTTAGIQEKILLIDHFMRDLTGQTPRIGVCALNPHAGEEGLFGDEESRLITPALVAARAAGALNVAGPLPADTLLMRAVAGQFDAVVAMYHDQGHIALKLVAFGRAVNVTLGLPIIRTSPSHGTAFDIAGRGVADPGGMISALQVAASLVHARKTRRPS